MIALDSNVFIYLLEAHPEYGGAALKIFRDIEMTSLKAYASELVFFELLAYEKLSSVKASEIQGALVRLDVKYVPAKKSVLLKAAELRRKHGLGALDSLHVASALEEGCDSFVTNDQNLLKKTVPGIRMLPLLG